jgi:hypothetical protein
MLCEKGSLKNYCILIMRAHNHGEGGLLALLALVSPRRALSVMMREREKLFARCRAWRGSGGYFSRNQPQCRPCVQCL